MDFEEKGTSLEGTDKRVAYNISCCSKFQIPGLTIDILLVVFGSWLYYVCRNTLCL